MGVGEKLFDLSISWKYLWRSNRPTLDGDRIKQPCLLWWFKQLS